MWDLPMILIPRARHWQCRDCMLSCESLSVGLSATARECATGELVLVLQLLQVTNMTSTANPGRLSPLLMQQAIVEWLL
jgi:hypothetical protein